MKKCGKCGETDQAQFYKTGRWCQVCQREAVRDGRYRKLGGGNNMSKSYDIDREDKLEIKRLLAVNAYLVALLQSFVDAYAQHPERLGSGSAASKHFSAARAALAAAKGE